MGYGGTAPLSGIPMGRALYGSLPDQLKDSGSFTSRLRDMLSLRERIGIATAEQLDVPPVSHHGLLVMVHRLPDEMLQVTVLNFAPEDVVGIVRSEWLPPGTAISDAETGAAVASVDELHSFPVTLGPHAGACLLGVVPDPAPASVDVATPAGPA